MGTRGAARDDVGVDGGSAKERRAPVLRAAESGGGRCGVRCVRGSAVRVVLRRRDRPAESGAGAVFSAAAAGYFEGLDSERAIAWRAADSLSIRTFLDFVLDEAPPDHSTLSRTRRLIDVETHRAVFTWVLQRLADAKLVLGWTVGIDATTLEANAAMRSIVRRDTEESYDAFSDSVGRGVRSVDTDPHRVGPVRPDPEEGSGCPVVVGLARWTLS